MSIQNPYVQPTLDRINFRSIRFYDLTVAAQCNDPVQIYIVFNSALAGATFDWTAVDGQLYQSSIAGGTVDVANTTPVVSLVTGTTGSGAQYDLYNYNLFCPPGYHMSLVAYSTAVIQKLAIAGTWAALG